MMLSTVAGVEADSFSLGVWPVLARATQCCSLQLNQRMMLETAAGAEADSFSLGVWSVLAGPTQCCSLQLN
jgi:hypothetical protein